MCVFVCVCVCVRERERARARARASERERARASVYLCVCARARSRVYCLLLNFVAKLEGSGLMVMRIGSGGQACVLLLALASCLRPA